MESLPVVPQWHIWTEYLMRHCATESGKSKGQFYTPAEVSRVIAQVVGIRHVKVTNDTTVLARPAARARYFSGSATRPVTGTQT